MRIFSPMDRAGRRVQLAPERIVVGELTMICFGVRISGRPDILEIPLY